MAGVQQSGNVTPGHLASFVTDGVIADAGANPYSQRVLATLLNASFNTTADQPILLPAALQAFQLTGIIIANPSASLTTAAGGFYPTISKGGSAIVAAGQVYTALTSSLLLMNATLTAYAQAQYFSRSQLTNWAIYLSLTTPQGADITANVYVTGIELA